MCPKIGNKIEENSMKKTLFKLMVLLSTRKGLILRFDSIQYSITTCKEMEHLDKNTFAFFMELLWKELWCLHFSKICSNEMADTGHYLNWGAQSFTTLMADLSQDKNFNVNGMIFDPPYEQFYTILEIFDLPPPSKVLTSSLVKAP